MQMTEHPLTTGEAPESEPARTCVVCGTARSASELLRLTREGGALSVRNRGGGRSAYVCVARGCVSALEERAVSRALRGACAVPSDFLAHVHTLAERRIYETLGLARRQGVLTLGADHEERARGDGLTVLAEDLSERTRAGALPSEFIFGTANELGRALGLARVGVVTVGPGRLSAQAAYWLRVWYESRPSAA
jgi:predicted RNA-binding protein YlxR (DUF448 family)